MFIQHAARFGVALRFMAAAVFFAGFGNAVAEPAGFAARTSNYVVSTVVFGIAVPDRKPSVAAGRARPFYISPSTQSLAVFTAGTLALNVNITPNSPGCRTTAGAIVCTAALRVASGTHIFTVKTFDQPNCAGHLLSLNTTGPIAVKAAGVTYVPLTLEGVVHSIALALSIADPDAGYPVTTSLTAVARDAGGNIIIGPTPFYNQIHLTTSNAANGALSKTLLTSPADEAGITVAYSGAKTAAIIFSAAAAGLTNVVPAVLTPMVWAEYAVYNFSGGAGGAGGKELLADARGALFGTTSSGIVYKLTPPAVGRTSWAEQVIGQGPDSRLIADATGALYGTSDICPSGCGGSVYKLTPAASGYTVSTLYTFPHYAYPSGNGAGPAGGLLLDSTGALFGTTGTGGNEGAGTVFELTRTTTGYVESLPYVFGYLNDGNAPYGGVIADAGGSLFGTTQNGPSLNGPGSGSDDGTVFELKKTAGGYVPSLIYTFGAFETGDGRFPDDGLLMDAGGALYGTTAAGGTTGAVTYDNGTVFKLTPVPNAGYYNETVLHSFAGGPDGSVPIAGLVADANGSLYGTTLCGGNGGGPTAGCSGAGIVFKLVPGASGYREIILHNFNAAGDGARPAAAVLLDAAGNIFGTTSSGGALGFGTVFELQHRKAVP